MSNVVKQDVERKMVSSWFIFKALSVWYCHYAFRPRFSIPSQLGNKRLVERCFLSPQCFITELSIYTVLSLKGKGLKPRIYFQKRPLRSETS